MSESDLKRKIIGYLNSIPNTYARVIQVSGIRGRTSPTKGVSDIICMSKGIGYAIEVKAATGILDPLQAKFLEGWSSAWGISIVARSVDDVKKYIK